MSRIDLGPAGNIAKEEIFRRIGHYDREMEAVDAALVTVEEVFPEVEAITGIHGIGLYTALLIIAEIAGPWRFDHGPKVGAYAGLTPRVSQSGAHCYHGHITRQGSPWLRWALVQVAMHVTKRDQALQAFYTRIRKRASGKIARVAVARKLAEICWQGIMAWHRAAVV